MNQRHFPLPLLTLLLGGCIEYFAEPPNLDLLSLTDGAAPDSAPPSDAAPPPDDRLQDVSQLHPCALTEPRPQLCPPPEVNAETAQRRCADGACSLRCVAGFHDLDGDYETGCEYACRPTHGGVETCDREDNDCDGAIDEDLTPPPADQQSGVCAGAVRVCVGQWVEPAYGERAAYEAPEVTCDGRDNDCDGRVDEGFGVVCCGPDDRGPPCNGCLGVARPEAGWVCIPPGAFTMGSPDDEEGRDGDEGPERWVVISQPFLLQKTEMTQSSWQGVWLLNPSHFSAGSAGGVCDGVTPGMCPVERVNWFEAASLANSVSGALGLALCYHLDGCNGLAPGQGKVCDEVRFAGPHCTGYRLPTEAEWEYAARAGTTTRFWSGDTEQDLGRVAWYADNSDGHTHPVGSKPANPWGLHDMHGNVMEWVNDWHTDYPAPRAGAADIDPTGPAEGLIRGVRGGSFHEGAPFARSADRFGGFTSARVHWVGFRFARAAHRPVLAP